MKVILQSDFLCLPSGERINSAAKLSALFQIGYTGLITLFYPIFIHILADASIHEYLPVYLYSQTHGRMSEQMDFGIPSTDVFFHLGM